jgi:hypothetical protein
MSDGQFKYHRMAADRLIDVQTERSSVTAPGIVAAKRNRENALI